jgi:hypothetical protein
MEIMPPICRGWEKFYVNHWLRIDKKNIISSPEIYNLVRDTKHRDMK